MFISVVQILSKLIKISVLVTIAGGEPLKKLCSAFVEHIFYCIDYMISVAAVLKNNKFFRKQFVQ